ncbi:zinc finger protein 675-like [Physella acuta]|uniref:zinc finger protein 675-like n=1 Tax=Physella acuta TaxID=109671 RepID=UPI0027DE505F|nr:zinc finger protein 675-like [Physella acuta]
MPHSVNKLLRAELEGSKASGIGKRGASELIGKFAAYECSYCSVILTEYDDLSLHSKNCPSPSCSMICLTCGDKFPSKPEMRQHLKLMHNHKTFGCKFCDVMFLSSSGLLSHTKAKHKPDPKTLCQICGQAFHNRANLEGHMNMHLGLKPFKCKRCGKSYGHSKSLITHEKRCTKIVSNAGKTRSQSNHTSVKSEMSFRSSVNSSVSLPPSQLHPNKSGTCAEDRNTSSLEPGRSFAFSETYQPFDETKKICSDSNLIQSTGQTFDFNSPSYQPLQSIDISTISNTSTIGNSLNETMYGQQTNNDYVLPQVAFDMYPPGILPDHA